MQLVGEILNFTISFVFWTVLGRILLDQMTGGRPNFFSGILHKATEPVLAVVGRLVPRTWAIPLVLILTFPFVGPLRFALLPLLRPQ